MTPRRDLAATCAAMSAALVILVACRDGGESRTKQAMPQVPLRSIVLKDLHPLHGGRSLELAGDGALQCRVVKWDRPSGRFQEKRYAVTLPATEVARVWGLVESHAFFKMQMVERPGVPDETRPAITVTLDSGAQHTVSKWANDQHAGFDAIYLALLDLAQTAAQSPPVHEASHEPGAEWW